MDQSDNIAERVIGAFGGLSKMSAITGWPIATIQHWKKSGRIPGWRRDGVVEAARIVQVQLPAEFIGQDGDGTALPSLASGGR